MQKGYSLPFMRAILLLLAAAGLAHAQPTPTGANTLVCSGSLIRAQNVDWGKTGIEFSLSYSPGSVSTPKADIEALNVPLRIELDERLLRATEAQPRMAEPEGATLRIAEFQVSRQTGRFTIQVVAERESGAVLATSTWEGTCVPKSKAERKF